MDEIYLPVQYNELNIEGLKSHFRYIVSLPKSGHCAEIYIHNLRIVIPITKKSYKTKSDQIIFLLRSGSISRNDLTELLKKFTKKGYEIKATYTNKRNLIKRLSLPISVDDPMLPIIGTKIIEELVLHLNSKWPCGSSIGYALGDEQGKLPGKIQYNDVIAKIGYKVGFLAGSAKRLIVFRNL